MKTLHLTTASLLIAASLTTVFLAMAPAEAPADSATSLEAAAIAFQRGDWERASDLIETALDTTNVAMLRLLADAYEKQGGTAIVVNLRKRADSIQP